MKRVMLKAGATALRFIDHLFAFEPDAEYEAAIIQHHNWSVWEQGYKAGYRNANGEYFKNPYGGRAG